MSYFIRYTNNPEADLERGYSFVGYVLSETREKAFANLADLNGAAYEEDFDIDTFIEDNDDAVNQDNTTGMWGTVRSGLCGYGAYDTVEEAIADFETLPDQYKSFSYLCVFEGELTNDDRDGQDDGITFKPVAIAHKVNNDVR